MSTPPVVFALHLAEMMNHYLPIMRHLGKEAGILNCAQVDGSVEDQRIEAMTREAGFAHLRLGDVLKDGTRFEVMVSNQAFVVPWDGQGDPAMLALAREHVRLTYALGKTEWNFGSWNRFYDAILCYGPYQKRLFEHHFPDTQVEAVGYPRFDSFFAEETADPITESDPSKPNVVWLPTYGTLSSVDGFAESIARLVDDYNVLVKLHPGTASLEPERLALLRKLPFSLLIEDASDNVVLFRRADFVLADYGGSPFGAIYTDRNLLLLNHDADIFAPDTGWLSADVQLRDDFPNLYPGEADRLRSMLNNAEMWERQRATRARYRNTLFADTQGASGHAAAEAIRAIRAAAKDHARAKRYNPALPPMEKLRISDAPEPSGDIQLRGWHARIGWVRSQQALLARTSSDLAATQQLQKEAGEALGQTRNALAQAQMLQQQAQVENERLAEAMSTTRAALDSTREALGTTKDALVQAIISQVDANQEKERLREALIAAEHRLAESEQQQREALAQSERLAAALETANAALTDALVSGQETRQESERLAAELETANAALAEALASGQEARQESERLAAELETANAALTDALASGQEARQESERLAAELETANGALAEALASGQEARRESERLAAELTDALASGQEARQEKERLAAALDAAERMLADAEKLQQEVLWEKERRAAALDTTSGALAEALVSAQKSREESERLSAELNEARQSLTQAARRNAEAAERQGKVEVALRQLEDRPLAQPRASLMGRVLKWLGFFPTPERRPDVDPAVPMLFLQPAPPKKRPAFGTRHRDELARALKGKRLVMVSDDVQIDRRILHEAHSLAAFGPEIIVMGRTGQGYSSSDIEGSVKIERIDYEAMHARRHAEQSVTQLLAATNEPDQEPSDPAQPAVNDRVHEGWASPGVEAFVMRQSRPMRAAIRMLIWPPYRLQLLRRYLPGWRLRWLALLYLPTLLLTPRPKAIAHHWKRVDPILRARLGLPAESGDEGANAQERALVAQLERPEDMNLWEQAVYQHLMFLRPDIIHVHDAPQLRPSVFAAEKLGVPVIYDAHELYPTIHTLAPEQQRRIWLTERSFMPRTQRTISVNPFFAAHQVKSYGIDQPEVILNATTLPDGFVRGRKLRLLHDQLQLAADRKVILFQGWVSIDRRIGDIVEAMADVPDHVHLALMGYGTDIPLLKARARELGVEGRVHFVPPVPQSELMPYVASADAGIIPYQPIDDCHRYCSPNKLFEFIAAGVPLIANDLPYLRSVVHTNGFGVTETLATPPDYARAIRRMFASDEGDEQRFRDRLLQRADPYLWPAQEQVLLHTYNEVLREFIPARKAAPVQILRPRAREGLPELQSPGLSQPRQTLRVFHGTANISGIPSVMARAERALGLDSKSVCYPSGTFQFPVDETLDYAFTPEAFQERFRKYADEFDVFVFHFGQSLTDSALADIPLLKRMGKTVIFYFHGCDIRQSKETISKYEFSACKACWPQQCSRNRDLALEMATRHADAIWVSTPDLLEFVPRSELFLQPIALEDFPFQPRRFQRAAPDHRMRVVHAPSDRRLKGTAYIEQAIEQLQAENVPLDLTLLHGLSHAELRAKLNDADFGIDQLLFGSYGVLAVEQMALGLPVLCNIRDDVWAKYPEPPPIWRTTPNTLAETLRAATADPGRLQKLATEGRDYVERHHSEEAAARRSIAVYERVRSGARLVA